MIDEIVDLYRGGDKHVLFKTELAASGAMLEVDPLRVRQMVHNLVKNALEATPHGEEVRLACTRGWSSIIFSVHNPGCIPRSVQLQIFQRSFSTKGKGRGIGTYSMKLFGERYLQGRVWFFSSEEKGTTFYLSLPLSPEDSSADGQAY